MKNYTLQRESPFSLEKITFSSRYLSSSKALVGMSQNLKCTRPRDRQLWDFKLQMFRIPSATLRWTTKNHWGNPQIKFNSTIKLRIYFFILQWDIKLVHLNVVHPLNKLANTGSQTQNGYPGYPHFTFNMYDSEGNDKLMGPFTIFL